MQLLDLHMVLINAASSGAKRDGQFPHGKDIHTRILDVLYAFRNYASKYPDVILDTR